VVNVRNVQHVHVVDDRNIVRPLRNRYTASLLALTPGTRLGVCEVTAPYPGPGGKVQVSNNGGTEPAWSRAGQELLYREGERFMSVELRASPQLALAPPRGLFTGPYERGSREDVLRNYAVSRDGNMFVALEPVRDEPVALQLMVVTDWTATLARTSDRK